MAGGIPKETADELVFYLSNWLRDVPHPHGANGSLILLSIEDKLPRLLVEFLLVPTGDPRIEAVGTILLTSFGRYTRTPRTEGAPLFSAVREISSIFEAFLKRLAYFRFPEENIWHQGLPEILFQLYPVSQEFRDNWRESSADFWRSRPVGEAVLRVSLKERNKAAHEAWVMPLAELETTVQCVLAAMLLVSRVPENYGVLDRVVESSRLTRLETLTPGGLFDMALNISRRFGEYAGLGLALDNLDESQILWGPIPKPIFSPTIVAAAEDRQLIRLLGISELSRPGYKQELIEALSSLNAIADEWEAYFNPRIAWHSRINYNDSRTHFAVVLSYPNSSGPSPLSATNILCICEERDGHCVPALVVGLDEFFDTVAVDDINGDGIREVVVTCFGGAHSMTVHIFQWDGREYRELLPYNDEGIVEGDGFFSSAPSIIVEDEEIVVRQRDYGSERPWEFGYEDKYRWDGTRYVRRQRTHFGPT